MNNLIEFISNFVTYARSGQLPQLGVWTYILLALLVAVEGPIATLLGAAGASAGLMRPIPVFFAAAFGNVTADLLWFSLGYLGRTEWLFRFGRWLHVHPELIEHFKKKMVEHAAKVIFLAKLTVSFIVPVLISAGLLRVSWRRWLPPLLTAETLWTGSLVLIGFYTTEALKHVERNIGYAIVVSSVLFIILLIFSARRLFREWDRNEHDSR